MTWLLLNKAGLFLMKGSEYISCRLKKDDRIDIPKDWFTTSIVPGTMMVNNEAENPKQSVTTALPEPVTPKEIKPALGNTKNYVTGRSHCTLTPLGSRDSKGFKQLSLKLFNSEGKVVDSMVVISGSPAAQRRNFIHPSQDYAGSGNPIPEGVYKIGRIIRMGALEKGVGYVKIPLDVTKEFDLNNRSEFLFHNDENRQVALGSLGCIVTYTLANMQKIVKWCEQQSRPEYIIVNYGLGVIK